MRIAQVASPEDARTALALTQEFGAWAKGVAKNDYGIDVDAVGHGLSTDVEDLLPPQGRLYLAVLDGSAVGVAGLKSLGPDTAEIKRVYVRPHARGRGVARALVQRLLDDARALSFRVVHLETAVFMREAVALYRSLGFADAAPYAGREFENVPGVDAITKFMTLSFDPQHEDRRTSCAS